MVRANPPHYDWMKHWLSLKGCSITRKSCNPQSQYKSPTVLSGWIILPRSDHSWKALLALLSLLLSETPSLWSQYFSLYISRNVHSLPPFPLHTQAELPCLPHGRDCACTHVLHNHEATISPLEGRFKKSVMCCQCCSPELSHSRWESEGGAPSQDSSSFSFFLPQPETTLRPALFRNLHCSLVERALVDSFNILQFGFENGCRKTFLCYGFCFKSCCCFIVLQIKSVILGNVSCTVTDWVWKLLAKKVVHRITNSSDNVDFA